MERQPLADGLFPRLKKKVKPLRVVTIVSLCHEEINEEIRTDLQIQVQKESSHPVFALRIAKHEDVLRISWKEGLEKKLLSDRYVDLRPEEYRYFAERFFALLRYVQNTYHTVLIFIEHTKERELISHCLEVSEHIYLSFIAEEKSIEETKVMHNFARYSLQKKETSLSTVYLMTELSPSGSQQTIKARLGMPISRVYRASPQYLHECVREEAQASAARRFAAQIPSWARDIARTRTGVVFSSGCAKGLAHIGAIQVLEENNFPIDAVAGCSMGSVIAALWAAGYNGKTLEKIAKDLGAKHPLWKLVDPVFPPRRGVIRGQKIRAILEKYLGKARFSDASIPLSIVATHLPSLDKEVFREGEIVSAILASSAIPGIVEPVIYNGKEYVDGGVVDPLPVRVLREQGIDRIIAVSVIPTPDDVRECSFFFENFPKPHRPIKYWLNKHFNYFYKNNVFDIVMRSFEASTIRVAQEDSQRADVVIRAVRCQDAWHEFAHPEKFITLGRNAARKQLASIQSLVTSM